MAKGKTEKRVKTTKRQMRRPKRAAHAAPGKLPAKQVIKVDTAKIDMILKQQADILRNEEAIRKDEKRIAKEESRIERLGEREIKLEQETLREERKEDQAMRQENTELAKLEQLEREVRNEVAPHPLTKLTLKDLMKGIVGAFIGVIVHFTFIYGVELAENTTFARATGLFIFTFIIGCIFLYATGFRQVKDKSVRWLLPYRIIVLYSTAVVMTVVTLWFFYPHFGAEPGLAYRQVANVNLSAVIGACTADLIGRE